MPATPLHALAVMFLYFKDKRRIDLLALTVSATFIDLEPLYYFLIGEPLDHRIWHSFAFALTVYAIAVTIGVYMVEHFFEKRLWSVYNTFKLKPSQVRYSLSSIYFCSLLGVFSHIFADMFTHEKMPYVVYPIANGNPFYRGNALIVVELIVILLSVYSCLLWANEIKMRKS